MAFQTQTQNRGVLAAQFPKSQLDTLRFGTQFPKSHWPLSFCASKPQRLKSQRLQNANASKSQTLAFYKSQRFSATKFLTKIRRLFVTCDVFTRYFFVAFSWPSSPWKNSVWAFFVVFSWLFRGPRFGQILRVLALEQSSDKRVVWEGARQTLSLRTSSS